MQTEAMLQAAQYNEFIEVLGQLSRLVVFSIILERALAFLFEYEWFDRLFTRVVPDPATPGATIRQSRPPGLKGLVAFAAAYAICVEFGFDVVGTLFGRDAVEPVGVLLTAFVVAGGSAGAIAVFQGFLNMSKDSRDAAIAARKAESTLAREIAEAEAQEAAARRARAEADLARAESEKKTAEVQTYLADKALRKAQQEPAGG